MKSSAELRQAFLDYFGERGHQIVPSSPLVPASDPTLLFTNAGMVQFKDVFLGRERRSYKRAASAQRCVRAGGKHNDLENVGYTARHHTFFEMLGNFSFGDYFKHEAIHYAWEFLTRVMELSPERLWVTVFEGDDEATDVWLRELGVDAQHFRRIAGSDNFWSMGETGPCGPCSEIFYDHGPEVAGGPPGSPDSEGDRYVEIWNLVFMQYDRGESGELRPLPRPSVDTGMGLERLAAVMQGAHSNYDIDLFRNLIGAVAGLAGTQNRDNNSLRVIADHIRSSAFLILDGVTPSNEGRGYVLRRIIRRAVRHGYKLGINEPFFYKLTAPLEQEMGDAYPELVRAREQVERVLRREEERFAETLDQGMRVLEQELSTLRGIEIPGHAVFRLYDTYGFPVDLTGDIARERGLSLDMTGFEQAMEEQRARARAASQFTTRQDVAGKLEGETEFIGYEHLRGTARVQGLLRAGESVERLVAGDEGVVVLDRTPFYAEAGGQVGDQGTLEAHGMLFLVRDAQKQGRVHAHIGILREGVIEVGDEISAIVDAPTRQATVLNHSATHLLHSALRRVLGEHVTQKGSLVAPDRLRFDFSHYEPLTHEQLIAVEQLVNKQIRENHPARTELMALEDALEAGAMALFGEKYDAEVRVLRLGAFSTELCGGTHVRSGGDIGLFKIVAETGIASGVRRIEAVTGKRAVEWVEQNERVLERIASLMKGGREGVDTRVQQLVERTRRLEKEVERLQAKLASAAGSDLAARAVSIEGVQVLAERLDGADVAALRQTVDQLKSKLDSAVIVLASVGSGKVSLVAGVTADLTDRLKAGELMRGLAERVGGRGGGRPDMAQGGGNQPELVPQALQSVALWVRDRLGPSR
jgi:alanyl-tRNA synthetase